MQEKQETQVRSLSGKDPLEKEMETHYSILAWKIPGTEESMGLQRIGNDRTTEHTHTQIKKPYLVVYANFCSITLPYG